MKFRLEKKRKKVKPPSKFAAAIQPWRTQLVVGGLLSVCIALGVTGLWYGTRVASLQITNVEVLGGATITDEVILEKVDAELSGAYYALVPHRFTWWYPEQAIVAAVESVSRVKQARLERKGQTLHVLFEEYRPAALWCHEDMSQLCLFLDGAGYAFAVAPDLIGSALVRYVTVGVEPTVGVEALTPSYVKNTTAFSEALEEEFGFYVTKVIRTDEVDTAYVLSTGAEIKVTDRMSAEETFDNLKAILFSKEFSTISDGSFYYIDLRFGNKVFVSETPPEVDATTEMEAEE